MVVVLLATLRRIGELLLGGFITWLLNGAPESILKAVQDRPELALWMPVISLAVNIVFKSLRQWWISTDIDAEIR